MGVNKWRFESSVKTCSNDNNKAIVNSMMGSLMITVVEPGHLSVCVDTSLQQQGVVHQPVFPFLDGVHDVGRRVVAQSLLAAGIFVNTVALIRSDQIELVYESQGGRVVAEKQRRHLVFFVARYR